MRTFSIVAKRLLVAASLVLVTACGSNGITDPSAAKKSGYLTVSASVRPRSTSIAPATVSPTTTVQSGYNVPARPGDDATVQSGYNVPAN